MRNFFFWRGIEEAGFKPTADGFTFYPYGSFARGYVVDAARKATIVAFIRRYYLAATVLLLATIILAPFAGSLVVLVVTIPELAGLVTWFHRGMRARLAGAPRSSERLSFGEAQRRAAATMSSARIVTDLVLGVLLVAITLVGLVSGLSVGDTLISVGCAFGVLFFGFCLAMGGYNAWVKWGRHA
jgi:hypothetical protein